EPGDTTYAARTMRWGGVIILLYVIYHLLDFTFGRVNPNFVPGDVYHNVVASFRVWPVSAFYVVAMVVVGLHIYHGVWSALQTLGLHRAPTDRWRRGAAGVLAAAIVAGGVNAAKTYQNDGDSVFRLFYDTVKGGDFRSREANVYRLAQISAAIIDQCAAQGVPFAREYGGLLANRSFGGVQVSRTFYARGQTGQQLLLGAYHALCRQIGAGQVRMYPRTEMLDVVVVDGQARGIITRNLVDG